MSVRKAKGVQADGQGYGLRCRKFAKWVKNRLERRAAKADPECQPGYGRYRGWLT